MSTAISRTSSAAGFAWQGWRLSLPGRWNPVRLEGNHDAGYALIADMDRPQLGIRWRKLSGKRFDPDRALRGEVGALAAAKARPLQWPGDTWTHSTIFLEPDPPGRDVWVAHSKASGRAIEIVHHVRRRDRVLEDSILPALGDTRPDEATPWKVFDLNCVIPGGFGLTHHRLNAGDLTLNFTCRRQMLTVRQVALAGMALNRLPLDKWLLQQQRAGGKQYKPIGDAVECSIGDLTGWRRLSIRRRRFGWMRWLPPQLVTYALHDQARDRLVFVQGNEDSLLRELATSVG